MDLKDGRANTARHRIAAMLGSAKAEEIRCGRSRCAWPLDITI